MNLESLFNTNTMFLSLAIGVIVYLIRTYIELKFPTISLNKIYGKVYVPLLAVLVGVGLCMVSSTVPAWTVAPTPQDRAILGIVCGWCSSFIFRIIRAFLIKEGGGSIPPGAYK